MKNLSSQFETYLDKNYGLKFEPSSTSSYEGAWLYNGETVKAVDANGKMIRIRMMNPKSDHPSIVTVTQVVKPLQAR